MVLYRLDFVICFSHRVSCYFLRCAAGGDAFPRVIFCLLRIIRRLELSRGGGGKRCRSSRVYVSARNMWTRNVFFKTFLQRCLPITSNFLLYQKYTWHNFLSFHFYFQKYFVSFKNKSLFGNDSFPFFSVTNKFKTVYRYFFFSQSDSTNCWNHV